MVGEPFYELDGQIAVDLPGARAVFTTARWGDIRETCAQISERLGVQAVHAHQVHGTAVVQLDLAPSTATLPVEADALITALTGIAPMVITADCVPVVVSAGEAVGAIHAGWKGLRDGVIDAGVARIKQLAPGAPLVAAIGPAAGVCCYEVGEEVHAVFASAGEGLRDGQNLDLKAIASKQLTDMGVSEIHDAGLCTICSAPDLLFSHRRDGLHAGRQGAITWLT